MPFPNARVFQFGVEKSANVTSVLWEFHDGTTSNANSPSVVYTIGGPYSVTLTCFGPPEFQPLRVSGSIMLRDDSNIDVQVTATATLLPPDVPGPSRTPRLTSTPGPSRTPHPMASGWPLPVIAVHPATGFISWNREKSL